MRSFALLRRRAVSGGLLLWVAACGSGGLSTSPPAAPGPLGFVYVANELDGTVSIYALNGGGQLSARGYVPTGVTPFSITVDPSGSFAYTANVGSSDISAYAIDRMTGALTRISCGPVGTPGCTGATAPTDFAAGAGATSVAAHPTGKFLYVANYNASDVSAYAINAATGALTPISCGPVGTAGCTGTAVPTNFATGANASGIAVDPTGKFAYVANFTSSDVSAYAINTTTGTLAPISCGPVGTPGCTGTALPTNFAAGTNAFSLATDPSGKFVYVANSGSGDISAYSIAETGALIHISNVTNGTGAVSIVVDPAGKFVYAAGLTSGDVSAYAINALTGALTHISCGPPGTAGCVGTVAPTNFASGSGANAVAVDPSGRFAYVGNFNVDNIAAYTINATTGALTQISCGAVGTQGCSGTAIPTLFAAGAGPISIAITPARP